MNKSESIVREDIKNSHTILSNPYAKMEKKAQEHIDPKRFGKVALLLGGSSGERAVSLESGKAILEALQRKGVDVEAIDAQGDFIKRLVQGNFDRAFNIVHGKQGEDGVMQGLLEMLQLPYVGSDVAASALAMDKARSKLIWSTLGLPTNSFGLAYDFEQAKQIVQELKTFPLAVKPNAEGSSLGVTKLEKIEDLSVAFEKARPLWSSCD
nr:D-ala D-ala ligase N-terminus [uncultured bacterium]